MSLTLQSLIENGLLDELANCFTSEVDAKMLSNAIKFPPAHLPRFDRASTPMAFWLEVCEQIDKGRTQEGFEALLSAASGRLPGNPVFAPFGRAWAKQASAQSNDPALKEAIAYAELVCEYDVFISYSSKDFKMVEQIAVALKRQGVRPWLDRWDLNYGEVFSKELQAILSRVKVVIVCYGTEGYGRWQTVEVDVAMERSVRGECLVIPLMLPGVTVRDLPGFLARAHSVQVGDKFQIDDPNFQDIMVRLSQQIRQHNSL